MSHIRCNHPARFYSRLQYHPDFNWPREPDPQWDSKPHNKYFSYFDSTLVVFFGLDGASGLQGSRRISDPALSFFAQPICLLFPLEISDENKSFSISDNFTAFCRAARIPAIILLDRLTTDCMKLVLPIDFEMYVENFSGKFTSKRQEFFHVVQVIRKYSRSDALNEALIYMLQPENMTHAPNPVIIYTITSPPGYDAENYVVDHFAILMGNWSFTFVTCSSLSQGRINYWGYLKPFHSYVYYALTTLYIFLMIVLVGQIYAKYRLSMQWHELVYVIVVVNTYKSIVTEDTIAPLVSSPTRTFDQLIGHGRFRIYLQH